MSSIQVSEDPQDASAVCAQKILDVLRRELAGSPSATLAISGGSTPKLLFAELAKAGFNWSKVHLFWVDERCVSPTDAQSNYKLAKDHWLDAVAYPAANVHRIKGELPAEEGAELYVDDIRAFFELRPGEIPSFDVIHRGMGPDAHTASLFPGEPLINDREAIAGAVFVPKFSQHRVTLLPAVLMNAGETFMLVAGDDKAEPLRTVMYGEFEPLKYPCQIGTHKGENVTWFLDKAAARLVETAAVRGSAS